MKEFEIFSAGEPPTFTLTTSDPNYWTERANYEISVNLYRANQAGMTISQPDPEVETEIEYTNGQEALSAIASGIEALVASEGIIYLDGRQIWGKSRAASNVEGI